MIKALFLYLQLILLLSGNVALSQESKPRIIVLTDIENEPDDAMSTVRFLTYSNQFDVEGLIATTSIHQKNKIAAWRLKEIVESYGKVQSNLLKHEAGYPSAETLLSIIKEGRPDYGMHAVGKGMDSEGSELIIKSVDKADIRPVWVLVWGGPNCLAQALWKVKETRSPKEVKKFVAKLRVYTISDQDDTGPWIRKNFKELFYIASPGIHEFGAYHHATWSGISGDKFHGRFAGANFLIVNNAWLDSHIRNKGSMGKQYPWMSFLMEGDSPSFMYLINNGLGNSEHPNWGSWGGRYEFYQPRTEKWFSESETRPLWTNAQDEVFGIDSSWHTGNHETIWRWREAYQNDFEARMDWTTKPYAEANHPPVVNLKTGSYIKAKVGDKIILNAEESSDPDGNNLSFKWFYYGEVGTFTISSGRTAEPLKIENRDKVVASFIIPKSSKLGTMHLIVAVTDNGLPALTRYKRVIVDVTE